MKRPTIADIAREAGVSIGAVSYALNGMPGVSSSTRQRIIDIADEIGWRPNIAARSLSVARAHAVGLVLARPARTLGVEPFFMQFIAGLEAELSARGSALLLQVVDSHDSAGKATSAWWAERRVDGVIVTDLCQEDSRIPLIEKLGIPAVLVGRPRPDSLLPAVWSDDAAAVTAAVDYLVSLGHRRIARVAGLAALDHTRVRTAAFRSAMDKHGVTAAEVVDTDYTWEQGAHVTRTLLARDNRPTAITYDNDLMAIAALGVAGEMGIPVPEKLSILAGDDSQLCALVHPGLTALSRDIAAYGSHAARILMAAIEEEQAESYQDATANLLVRASTGPPEARDSRQPNSPSIS